MAFFSMLIANFGVAKTIGFTSIATTLLAGVPVHIRLLLMLVKYNNHAQYNADIYDDATQIHNIMQGFNKLRRQEAAPKQLAIDKVCLVLGAMRQNGCALQHVAGVNHLAEGCCLRFDLGAQYANHPNRLVISPDVP